MIGGVSATIDLNGDRLGNEVYSFVDVGDGVVIPAPIHSVIDDGEHTLVSTAIGVGRLDTNGEAEPVQELPLASGTIGRRRGVPSSTPR